MVGELEVGRHTGPVGAASGAKCRVKNPPAMQGTQVQPLSREDPLEEEMATHSSILVWRIPWAEEPSGLQSMESQRAGHDGVSDTFKLDAWKWGVSFLLL